jgi:hypothetical protein
MLIKIKGYAKLTTHQLKVHMEYDGKNQNVVNPNGNHEWCLWMQSMSMLKKEDKMAKLKQHSPWDKFTYERCMKINVMLNCATLNRWLQKGQGTWGHARKDHMTNIRKIHSGCGKRSKKGADEPRDNERTSWSKLKGMEMMGKWIGVGTQLGTGVKLSTSSPWVLTRRAKRPNDTLGMENPQDLPCLSLT